MDENHSKAIRAKFTTEDIRFATARAEKFLAGYGVQAYSRLTAYEIIKMLADYDLNQLDEMFGGGVFTTKGRSSLTVKRV